jgi:hypothetical protein
MGIAPQNPKPTAEVTDPFADLRAGGLVREATRPKRKLAGHRRLVATAPVSDLVAEQRR